MMNRHLVSTLITSRGQKKNVSTCKLLMLLTFLIIFLFSFSLKTDGNVAKLDVKKSS